MPNRDLVNLIKAQTTLPPATYNSGVNGNAVQIGKFNSAAIVVSVGTITDGAHTLTLQEADASGGPWNNVAAGEILGSLAALASDVDQEVGYMGAKDFLRVNTAASGTTGGAYGVSVVKGNPRTAPA